eukprot:scaffold21821_cov67-Phaeocystis_antarctica.AAC.2
MPHSCLSVVRREPERQQLLLRHGAARVVPEAVEELGLPLSKLRVITPGELMATNCAGKGGEGVAARLARRAGTVAQCKALR